MAEMAEMACQLIQTIWMLNNFQVKTVALRKFSHFSPTFGPKVSLIELPEKRTLAETLAEKDSFCKSFLAIIRIHVNPTSAFNSNIF